MKIASQRLGYKDLAAYVWQTATKEEIAKARADYEGFYKENKIEYTEELLQSEIVARLVGERLQSEKFLKRYAEKDASMIKRAAGFMKGLRKATKDADEEVERITGEIMLRMDRALAGVDVKESDGGKKYFDLSTADNEYIKATVNKDILDLVEKVERGDHKKDDNVALGQVSEKLASDIQKITGIDVNGFKIMVEARLIEHILIDHGKNGKTDRTMSDYTNIAKMEYTINNYDAVSRGKSTQAYKNVVDRKTRGAQTVLYEKSIGDKSYYVVQAVPDTKARTLFVVSTFIGEKGYKKEAQQFTIAKSHGATSKIGTADTSTNSISQRTDLSTPSVKKYDIRKKSAGEIRSEGVLAGQMSQGRKDAVKLRKAEEKLAEQKQKSTERLAEYKKRVAVREKKMKLKAREAGKASAERSMREQMARNEAENERYKAETERYKAKGRSLARQIAQDAYETDAKTFTQKEVGELIERINSYSTEKFKDIMNERSATLSKADKEQFAFDIYVAFTINWDLAVISGEN